MYFQRDYVLRMIEMLGDLLRKIRTMGEDALARADLDEIAGRGCGLSLSFLKEAEPAVLRSALDEPQRYLAAQVLLLAAELDARTHTADAVFPAILQAFILFSSLTDPDYLLPASDHVRRLMESHLADLPAAALESAAGLMERAGRYADAEDTLYAAWEQDVSVKLAFLAFYERLLALPDGDLLDGGLTRAEIIEGKAALI